MNSECQKHDEDHKDHGEHLQQFKYFFFLDGKKYESNATSITGADVRAKLPPEKAGYAIYLEGHGDEPDKQITDAESFTLEKKEPHFYSVPPANFGLA